MLVLRSITDLRAWRGSERLANRSVGMVPTMGYLHQGHLSLVAEAKSQTDTVLMSIFVNPLQFGPNEDLTRYPRNEARDLQMAEAAGVNAVFIPSDKEMYPQLPLTNVKVTHVSSSMCGESRPGHFDGVAFVVLKLFQLVQPDVACFGMKDAQQVAVIQQMVNDLCVPVRIVPCPIVRESDGLAMSSRNVYLTEEERFQALVLSKALEHVHSIRRDHQALVENSIGDLKVAIRKSIEMSALAVIDYIEIRTFPALTAVEEKRMLSDALEQPLLVALAVRFGKTRLIDNTILDVHERRDNDV